MGTDNHNAKGWSGGVGGISNIPSLFVPPKPELSAGTNGPLGLFTDFTLLYQLFFSATGKTIS